jgi:L-serine dehydratase
MKMLFPVLKNAAPDCGTCAGSTCTSCSPAEPETGTSARSFETDRAIRMVPASALAASEENAPGHIIVTAPRGGTAGVLPAVVKGLRDYRKVSADSARHAFLAAAAAGYLCKHNATLSAAEGGCQAEI